QPLQRRGQVGRRLVTDLLGDLALRTARQGAGSPLRRGLLPQRRSGALRDGARDDVGHRLLAKSSRSEADVRQRVPGNVTEERSDRLAGALQEAVVRLELQDGRVAEAHPLVKLSAEILERSAVAA